MRDGYDPQFLGSQYEIPLPQPSLAIKDDVLELDNLDSSPIVNYVHYSVLLSKSNKQAFYSAANLDRDKLRQVSDRNWFADSRVGRKNQNTNEYYKSNVWDRGHLTRRSAVTWGDDTETARNASNDSCSYTNASLQHKNFNQDEWRVVERLADNIQTARDGKFCIFTGPLFTQTDRWYTRRVTSEMARIPSGFWKVLAFYHAGIDDVVFMAFALFQDRESMLDRRNGKRFLRDEIYAYQVTTTELGLLTGLEFPSILLDKNPLNFSPHPGINQLPEGIGIPQGMSDEEFEKAFVYEQGKTLEKLTQQRNLDRENFEAMVGIMDH